MISFVVLHDTTEDMCIRNLFDLRLRVGIYRFDSPASPSATSSSVYSISVTASRTIFFPETSQWKLVFVLVSWAGGIVAVGSDSGLLAVDC